MLSIFRPKISAISLLEGGMDFHNHLLPGIDDGAKSVSDSMLLIRQYDQYGIHHLIATPHVKSGQYPNTDATIENALWKLNQELTKQHLTHIKITAAAEYLLDIEFEKLLHQKPLRPIKDPYILVELPFVFPLLNVEDLLYQIMLKGYIPILAHPERYGYMHGKLGEYRKLKKQGCLFQVNALSLSHHYGNRIYKEALFLIRNGLIDFIGSDIHTIQHFDVLKKATIKSRDVSQLKRIVTNTQQLLR